MHKPAKRRRKRIQLIFLSLLVCGGILLITLIITNTFFTRNKEALTGYTEPEQLSAAPPSAAEDARKFLIEDFPIILQMPELPTGCEITAMTMVLSYYGFDADKTVLATEYLPVTEPYYYYGEDGRLYGADLNRYFIGDPTTQAGYICGTTAITTAANSYLQDMGSSLRAIDKTGSTPEELYRLVSENIPVVVWVTIDMQERAATQGWYTETGEYVDWSTNDHGAVLVGYTDDTVFIADSIAGLVTYSKEAFEAVFASRSGQCVLLQ